MAANKGEPKNSTENKSNFIRTLIEGDLASNKHQGRVATRFPPEPNGYLHIGHAKSICLNFGLAKDYKGTCNLRFDDTNPIKEDERYAQAIQTDIRWLGFEWQDRLFHASDYFEKMYAFAVHLIEAGKAYVDGLSEENIRLYRGTVTEPGRPSPDRQRSITENLDLFKRMRAGEFKDGEYVLRAKIDMAAANMKMRDPLLYRIRHVTHHRTGNDWCIYPMYDFAHCLSDALENITHSLCTLEFENNRDIYDWVIENTPVPSRPRQYEFARLNLNYTVMSKRKLLELVEGGYVSGWDDPRMPTLAGMRRRGYTPASIRHFCEGIGVAKANSTVDISQLEYYVREDLNTKAPRVMAVLDPLEVVVESWPKGETAALDGALYPHDVPLEGSRKITFGQRLYIEKSDFRMEPPNGYYRLSPGAEVRLRHAYIIRCERVETDPQTGDVVRLICSHDPATLGKNPRDRKVKGTIHWVAAINAVPAEIRLYDRLFAHERPGADKDVSFLEQLNPDSLIIKQGYVESYLGDQPAGRHYQFERKGYFISDDEDSIPGKPVFNQTVALRDTWTKTAPKPKLAAKKPKQKRKSAPTPPKPAFQPEGADQIARWQRFTETLKLHPEEAETLILNDTLAELFEASIAAHDNPRALAAWVVNEVARVRKASDEALAFNGAQLGALVAMIDDGTISTRSAKDVFARMVEKGGQPQAIVDDMGLRQVSDEDSLQGIVAQVLADHPDEVSRYRNGEKKLVGFLMGQVMKATKGQANPKLANQLLRKNLEA